MKKFSLNYKVENGESKITRFMEGNFKVSDHLKMCYAMNQDISNMIKNLIDTVAQQEEGADHIKKMQDNIDNGTGIVTPSKKIIV